MEPLFSARPRLPRPPRAEAQEPVPEETSHPGSLTARLRRFLLTDGEALFAAQERQADYLQAEAEADIRSRSE